MSDELEKIHHPADTNGDGKVSKEEEAMYLEFKRKELDDADAMRDAQRKMTWFALGGLLLYPFAVVLASLVGLDEAQKTLGSLSTCSTLSTLRPLSTLCSLSPRKS